MNTCVQCKTQFEITDEDRVFYKKIGVPEPTFCPDCRLQRRLAWRNERSLYQRKCDLCKKDIISIYSPEKSFKVYCPECWWSDKWNALSYKRDIDFSKPFFEQFDALAKEVPRPSLITKGSENCAYAHNTTFSKNCYLCFCCYKCEDCIYNYMLTSCTGCVDNLSLKDCELCYESINCIKCYNGKFLQNCEGCMDSAFCFDCKNLTNCFGCVNLQNKQYHIFNKQVSPEEYKNFMQGNGSRAFMEEMKKRFDEFKKTQPHRFAKLTLSEDCTGDHIYFSKNCTEAFDIEKCEDSRFVHHTNDMKDSMDVFGALMGGELQYENSAAGGGINVQSSYLSWHCTDASYLNYCQSCTDAIGCISLKNKKFCILNQQYREEEYRNLRARLVAHMKETGEWGNFFPSAISPYGYNETVAQEFFPLTKDRATAQGFLWKDEISRATLPQTYSFPDHIKEVQDDVVHEVLVCSTEQGGCGKNYKILAQELDFYRRMLLPLPHTCHNCRHAQRMRIRNPRKLWKKQCMCARAEHATHPSDACGNTFETTYSPDRKESIYCEQCYQSEMV